MTSPARDAAVAWDTEPASSVTELDRFARAVATVRRARTTAETLAAVPRAVTELGFERVMLSLVDDEYWRPQAVQIVADTSWSARVMDSALQLPQAICDSAPERRVIERATPIVVPPPRDVHPWSKKTWDYRHPRKVTAYVAAPVEIGGRVAALIHADRATSCRALTGAHATLLWSFCGVVELALTARAAEERLQRMRGHLDDMLDLTGAAAHPRLPGLTRPELTAPREIVAFDSLTARERHVLELLARGLSNTQIAEQLLLTEGTVKAHVKHILAKTQSPNRTAAALKWANGDVG
ncbi:LuxR C-terminal-related transcriptional regulator [Microbacterium sp. B19]|uniref:LuxR C-terminal-related transcriptional regulator n=1 Tax=Microbacterium sp. B19 TaxID=96765 RepID=UPI0003456C95|nr:LuxR C-terminal-related transcriptional regulator [Microbacterium sp. B19]